MSDPIKDYARAVANLAWRTGHQCNAMPTRADLDAIIASVPAPEAQHHDAPTCNGWWWARHSFNRRWEAVLYVYDGNQEEPEQYVVMNGQEEGRDVSEFDRWVGPLLPPDTTTPAPDVQAQIDATKAEIARLEAVLRWTHTTYCPGGYEERGLHAPECLIEEIDDSDGRHEPMKLYTQEELDAAVARERERQEDLLQAAEAYRAVINRVAAEMVDDDDDIPASDAWEEHRKLTLRLFDAIDRALSV